MFTIFQIQCRRSTLLRRGIYLKDLKGSLVAIVLKFMLFQQKKLLFYLKKSLTLAKFDR